MTLSAGASVPMHMFSWSQLTSTWNVVVYFLYLFQVVSALAPEDAVTFDSPGGNEIFYRGTTHTLSWTPFDENDIIGLFLHTTSGPYGWGTGKGVYNGSDFGSFQWNVALDTADGDHWIDLCRNPTCNPNDYSNYNQESNDFHIESDPSSTTLLAASMTQSTSGLTPVHSPSSITRTSSSTSAFSYPPSALVTTALSSPTGQASSIPTSPMTTSSSRTISKASSTISFPPATTGSHDLTRGAISGIAIGFAGASAVVVLVVPICLRRRRKRTKIGVSNCWNENHERDYSAPPVPSAPLGAARSSSTIVHELPTSGLSHNRANSMLIRQLTKRTAEIGGNMVHGKVQLPANELDGTECYIPRSPRSKVYQHVDF